MRQNADGQLADHAGGECSLLSPFCASQPDAGQRPEAHTQGVALYGAIDRNNVDPTRFAVTLTFVLQTAYCKASGWSPRHSLSLIIAVLLDITFMLASFEQEMVSGRLKKYS